MNIAADLVWYIHVFIVILVAGVPFLGNQKMLALYKLLVPFLFFHWATNNDTCALTTLEQYLRGCDKKESFLQQILGPIYILPMDSIGHLSKLVVLLLFYYVMYKTNSFEF